MGKEYCSRKPAELLAHVAMWDLHVCRAEPPKEERRGKTAPSSTVLENSAVLEAHASPDFEFNCFLLVNLLEGWGRGSG